MDTRPFDSLDSAHEYIRLLAEQLRDVSAQIEGEMSNADRSGAKRSLDALRLVQYKLHQLGVHITASRAVLNDLKMLRRVVAGDANDGAQARRPSHVQRKSPL